MTVTEHLDAVLRAAGVTSWHLNDRNEVVIDTVE